MKNSLRLKDILLIALLAALYFVFYMAVMMIITVLGPFGHAISPGLNALLTGSIFYFMVRRLGRYGQFLLFSLLIQGAFILMGGGYLPWFITTMVGAFLAEILAGGRKDHSVLRIALASAVLHVGQAWGAILPSVLFLDRYRETWIQRGQPAEAMDQLIAFTSGPWAVYSTLIVAVLSMIGVFLGRLVLKKHLKEA